MPKISAPSVAEHVAQQEALVFDTALRLFTERGYSHVTLGDIAAEVGLKRNSLYRYFPSKAHILVRWFRAELPAQAAHSSEVLTGTGPPLGRIVRWADDQLDYALRPEHALIAALSDVVPDLDPETRAEPRTATHCSWHPSGRPSSTPASRHRPRSTPRSSSSAASCSAPRNARHVSGATRSPVRSSLLPSAASSRRDVSGCVGVPREGAGRALGPRGDALTTG